LGHHSRTHVLQAGLEHAQVEIRGCPVAQCERMALGGGIATCQTHSIRVDGLPQFLGLEKIVAFFSDVRRRGGIIVPHVNIQRRSQHFVFVEQRAREHELAFGRLQRGQVHVNVTQCVGHL